MQTSINFQNHPQSTPVATKEKTVSINDDSVQNTPSVPPASKEEELTVEDFEPGMKVRFNREVANKQSRDRIPAEVNTGDVIAVSVANVRVQWEGLEVPQYHHATELQILANPPQ
ncbi:MAG: hypothetical protein HC862_17545 [Scytonema sp. RU_4_4]|nr:hypothetical protein [Scytonema sp. RU_4_4]